MLHLPDIGLQLCDIMPDDIMCFMRLNLQYHLT